MNEDQQLELFDSAVQFNATDATQVAEYYYGEARKDFPMGLLLITHVGTLTIQPGVGCKNFSRPRK